MIAALVQKDVRLFFRNQFFALLTALGLVLYIAIYFLLPASVDDSFPLALYVEGLPAASVNLSLGEGLAVTVLDSETAFTEGVESGAYLAGLALPAGSLPAILRGDSVTLDMLFAPGTAPEMRSAITSVLQSRLNALATPDSTITRTIEVVGPQAENPLSLRDRILPTLLVLILVVESMGLATLIVEESEYRTANALLVTKLGVRGFFTAKALMGTGLAFIQGLLIIALTGQLFAAPILMLASLLLGCLLITGVGFLLAAVAKDMVSVMTWGILAMIVLVLPSITILLPSIGSGWMQLIPSYYLVDTLHRVINYGASWADVMPNLLALLVIGIGTLIIGSVVLRRRFQ